MTGYRAIWHPLKYGLGLAEAARALGVQIYEHSPVVDIRRGESLIARTSQGRVTAKFGVLAGNCTLGEYGPGVAPEIAPRIMPVGTYIVGTAPMDPALCRRLIPSNAAVCDNNFVLDYFRFSADHRMLFGGRVSYTTRTPADLQGVMTARMRQVFPALQQVPVEYVWGGFVDISMNRAPDFGRLGDNLYYLQGFSGHGLALAGLAGRLVAEAVSGQAKRLDVFTRLQHRAFPGGDVAAHAHVGAGHVVSSAARSTLRSPQPGGRRKLFWRQLLECRQYSLCKHRATPFDFSKRCVAITNHQAFGVGALEAIGRQGAYGQA